MWKQVEHKKGWGNTASSLTLFLSLSTEQIHNIKKKKKKRKEITPSEATLFFSSFMPCLKMFAKNFMKSCSTSYKTDFKKSFFINTAYFFVKLPVSLWRFFNKGEPLEIMKASGVTSTSHNFFRKKSRSLVEIEPLCTSSYKANMA